MIWLRILLITLAAISLGAAAKGEKVEAERVNILLITVDDMNWNSVGAFGNPIADITPHIDQLAHEGRRFEHAYVAAANCSPSRVALQTGLYPQQSGATGFFYIDDAATPSIATELRKIGFFTGIINKTADTNPAADSAKYWDYRSDPGEVEKSSPRAFGSRSAAFFDQAKKRNQPFYLVVNIADPHKPNFNDREAAAKGSDVYKPSRIIPESEVTVPAFLPDLPLIKTDVRNYYNSVKRADDAVGQIIKSLRESGLEQKTLVIFLSDHGMPFPFAKSSVYQNGLRTPLVMKWPGKIEPGSLETQIVSTVDLMPTILGGAEAKMPADHAYFGQDLLGSVPAQERRYAFGGFDENARGYPVPMRGVLSRDWGYAFNAWVDGEHTIKVDDMNHMSFKQMQKYERQKPAVRERLNFFMERATEELCHLKVDPDCLVNLAGDPTYASVLAQMQDALRAHMVRTDDYLLEAFDMRGDRAQLRAFMRREHEAAKSRAGRLLWKRSINILGNTRSNGELFRKGLM
ncbi:MAG: sulfatase [Pontixanthobacter sp.]